MDRAEFLVPFPSLMAGGGTTKNLLIDQLLLAEFIRLLLCVFDTLYSMYNK